MQPLKRYPRVERETPVEIYEDENSHLWAVSYADFLMALLSFFILFFSIDESHQNHLFIQLAKEFSTPPGNSSSSSSGVEGRSMASQTTSAQASVSLQNVLESLELQTTVEKNRLIVDFPKDFFANGQYEFAPENEKYFLSVLEKIRPFKKDLKIYFEGHTDDRPSNKKVNTLVVDNFLLSSLRASNALSSAKKMGFEEQNMFIQAASSHKRNTRSLSLHLLLDSEVRK